MQLEQLSQLVATESKTRNQAVSALRESINAENSGLTAPSEICRQSNATLQLLKEAAVAVTESVGGSEDRMPLMSLQELPYYSPLIPISLKETDFNCYVQAVEMMKLFLARHYFVESRLFDSSFNYLLHIRKNMTQVGCDEKGFRCLMEFYNMTYFIEKRSFSDRQSARAKFQWYDTLSGIPSSQESIGFDKGSVLFNIAAISSQIACSSKRNTASNIKLCMKWFLKSAGFFEYLLQNFSHAPSRDMQSSTLTAFNKLMIAQAEECRYEENDLTSECSLVKCHTAAQVSVSYKEAHKLFIGLSNYLVPSWCDLVYVKSRYFAALAHYHKAVSLIQTSKERQKQRRRQKSRSPSSTSSTTASTTAASSTHVGANESTGPQLPSPTHNESRSAGVTLSCLSANDVEGQDSGADTPALIADPLLHAN